MGAAEKPNEKIHDYIYSETEFNLMRMYKNTIELAFDKIKIETNRMEFIAVQLGISSKQLYRYLNIFGLRHLLKSPKK